MHVLSTIALEFLAALLIGTALACLLWPLHWSTKFQQRRREAALVRAGLPLTRLHGEPPRELLRGMEGSWCSLRFTPGLPANFLTGTHRDFALAVFDYYYDDADTALCQTIIDVQLALPRFVLCPDYSSVLPKRWPAGFAPLPIPPALNGRLLAGEHAAAVQALLTPAFIQRLRERPELVVESLGNRIVFYEQGHRLAPERMMEMLDIAVELARELLAAGRR